MNIIGQYLQCSAMSFPQKVALVDGDTTFTYAELYDAVNRVAAGMRREGLQPGDRVAYHGNNRWELVVTMFAVIHGGFILCPLNVMLRPAELEYILELSRIRFIFTTQEGEDNVRALVGKFDFKISSYDDSSGLFSKWMEIPTLEFEVARRPDDVVALFFTSGTTGNPKGAPIDHEFINHLTHSWIMACRYTPDDVYLVMTPMFWAVAPIHGILPIVRVGGKIVLMSRFDLDKCCDLIQKHAVTSFFAVPTLCTLLIDQKANMLKTLKSLRVCCVGGSPLNAETVAAFESLTGATLLNTYGSTEAGAISRELIGMPRRAGSAGAPGSTITMKIVDQNGQVVKPGTPGEIHARGFTAIKGYWKNDKVDPSSLENGWVNTGDIGVMEDGFLRILDRTKDMIITGGANIYSAEVERVISQHHLVEFCALIGVPDRVMGELPVAYIVRRGLDGPSSDELSTFCRERLSSYKIPRRFIFVESLPMTPTGKVQKVELRKLARNFFQDAK